MGNDSALTVSIHTHGPLGFLKDNFVKGFLGERHNVILGL